MACFKGAVEVNSVIMKDDGDKIVSVRNFKKCLVALRGVKKDDKFVFKTLFAKDIENFTHYMEKENDGYVRLKDLIDVDHKKYKPEEDVVADQVEQDYFTYTTFRDIIKDLQNIIKSKNLNIADLYLNFDKDKNRLLGSQEINEILCFFDDSYKQEPEGLLKAHKKILDTGLKNLY